MENIIEKYISELNSLYETSFELTETSQSHYELEIEDYTLFLAQKDNAVHIDMPLYIVEGDHTLDFIELLGGAQYLDMGTGGATIYYDQDNKTLSLLSSFEKGAPIDQLYIKIETIINSYAFLQDEIEKKRTLLVQ